MIRLNLGGYALAGAAIAALLTGCGGGSTALPVQSMTSSFATPLGRDGFETVYTFRGKLQDPNGLTAFHGVLYGTGNAAGYSNYGTVFSLDPSGKVHILHVFHGGADGAYPTAGLIVVNGVLFGTTAGGGDVSGNPICLTGPPPSGGQGCGTVFSITTSGKEHVLYRFQWGSDGADPAGDLTLRDGKLYGVTLAGGLDETCEDSSQGCGTVFEVDMAGKERIVYRFKGGRDGAFPGGTLLNLDGNLFGTTNSGGQRGCYHSTCGTLFDVTTSGREEVLYRFKGGTDGGNPSAGLISVGGALYGTTTEGGSTNCYGLGCGTIFKATTSGDETVLYSFKGIPDGAYPESRLTAVNGAFYGTTPAGGQQCDAPSGPDTGTVFELTASGTEKIVHRFWCRVYRRAGIEPVAPLVRLGQKLYGTTTVGGHHNNGTAFALNL
jgi:uncharacterized repeat protein (TIGR03803 family)